MSAWLRPVVAIDGPAGAGKSSAALALAKRLGFVRVDSGALYRAVALLAHEQRCDWNDEHAMNRIAAEVHLEYIVTSDGTQLLVNGVNRQDDLRTPEISQGASQVSRFEGVRQALLGVQRKMGEQGGVVLEGRDIGTVVFPDAEIKIFLTASPEERARRRVAELKEQGIEEDYDVTLAEIRDRDRRDETRAVAPLRAAADALHVDATRLSLAEVVDRLEAIVRKGPTKRS